MPVTHFQEKVAAITGAGSGMGQALAILLSNHGCHVAISDVNQTGLDETLSLLNQEINATSHLVDVASREEMAQFADQVIADHGRCHMIFNNAGVSVTDTAEHMSYEDFEWLMGINFWGVVHGTKSFLPHLRKMDEAAIINTSSIFGSIAVPTQSAYNASKFAVKGYTLALRQELSDTSVGVSCVQPGGVKTNIVNASRFVPQDNESMTKEDLAVKFTQSAGLTSEGAATQILAGVLKNKARILVGRDAKLISVVERIAPSGYMKLFSKILSAD